MYYIRIYTRLLTRHHARGIYIYIYVICGLESTIIFYMF